MSTNKFFYIKVIVPLNVPFQPTYSVDRKLAVGQRVRVPFAGREYVAVVSDSEADPSEAGASEIRPVNGIEEYLPSITAEEIRFWQFLSDYYLCSIGEVYKAAYPALRIKSEQVTANACRRKGVALQTAAKKTVERKAAKPLVYIAADRRFYYIEEARRTLEQGSDVLILIPEIAAGDNMQATFAAEFGDSLLLHNSSMTSVRRRRAAESLRVSDSPKLVLGTRSSLFLPFRNLGLIIVDEEQDRSHKQPEPDPRFNARDAAVVLGSIHGAAVILGSACPSMETLFNIRCGKYDCLRGPGSTPALIIDIPSEKRKRGMKGDFSIKALEAAAGREGKLRVVYAWEEPEDLRKQTEELLCGRDVELLSLSQCRTTQDYSAATIVLNADSVFRRDDFRSDEKCLQTLSRIASRSGLLILQTSKKEHPVFSILAGDGAAVDTMLSERRDFNLPPFSRLVDIVICDSNQRRLSYLGNTLASRLLPVAGRALPMPSEDVLRLRLTLPKTDAAAVKKAIVAEVNSFGHEKKYAGHIRIDVDPL